MSVEYHIAMKYFYNILYPWEPQYCLLTAERMLTIMSVDYHIAIEYFKISIHERHNIVCWILTYDDNIVSWRLYCYEIFIFDVINYYTTVLLLLSFKSHRILSVDFWKYADINVCWVSYCYEIFLRYIVPMRATIFIVCWLLNVCWQ
jgi:hypothetical protein